jgi:chromosome segregation ATPase
MILNVFIYTCMVFLTAACSSEPGDSLSAARAEPPQAGTSGLPVDKSAGASHADTASADEARRMAQDLQNTQAELAAARKRADEQQEQARQATEATQQARAQIERLTRMLAVLRRADASKSREIVACKRASAEMLAANAASEQTPSATEQPLTGAEQQACDQPRFVFKRSDALN